MGKISLRSYGLYPLDDLKAELLTLGIFSDERPVKGLGGFVDWRLHGRLSRLLMSGFFSGHPGEKLLYPLNGRLGADNLLLVGVGRRDAFSANEAAALFRTARETAVKMKASTLALSAPSFRRQEDCYSKSSDVVLALIISELTSKVEGETFLYLPEGANLKEMSLKMEYLRQKLAG